MKDLPPMVEPKDIRSGRTYWLTGAFYGDEGAPVKLSKKIPEREAFPGSRRKGEAAVMRLSDGRTAIISAGDVVFSEDPGWRRVGQR